MIQTTEPVIIMTQSDLAALVRSAANAAADLVVSRMAQNSGIWTAKQVAEYLQVSAYTLAHEWAYRPGFPAALRFGDGPKAKRRWRQEEIIEWADRQQEKKAA